MGARMNLAKLLRAAIDRSGKSRYALAKETGVDESVINKFMGGTDIRLETAGKLMEAVGLKVLTKSKRNR